MNSVTKKVAADNTWRFTRSYLGKDAMGFVIF